TSRVAGRHARALRHRARPVARRGRLHEPGGASLPRRVELGVRLPSRPCAQAPRDGRPLVRRDRLAGRLMAEESTQAPATGGSGLTIEAIVAVDSPREFRIHPRDRVVAYTAEAAGSRQLFTLSLRGTGTPPVQVTASDKAVSDPQWSPDGRRLAFVREDEIWIVEADGSRLTRVVAKPGGGRDPRWSPDGRRLAFVSRRRGWSQVWLIDAPVPRRGRPAAEPRPPEPTVLTEPGIDVDAFEWAPDGGRLAVMAHRQPEPTETAQIALVDVSSGAT